MAPKTKQNKEPGRWEPVGLRQTNPRAQHAAVHTLALFPESESGVVEVPSEEVENRAAVSLQVQAEPRTI